MNARAIIVAVVVIVVLLAAPTQMADLLTELVRGITKFLGALG